MRERSREQTLAEVGGNPAGSLPFFPQVRVFRYPGLSLPVRPGERDQYQGFLSYSVVKKSASPTLDSLDPFRGGQTKICDSGNKACLEGSERALQESERVNRSNLGRTIGDIRATPGSSGCPSEERERVEEL